MDLCGTGGRVICGGILSGSTVFIATIIPITPTTTHLIITEDIIILQFGMVKRMSGKEN